MTIRDHRIRHAIALLCAAVGACRTIPAQGTVDAAHGTTAERPRIALSHALPPLDGSQLEATVVEVTYGPGGASSPHTHPCPVIGYVVQGALRSQVKGEPEATYTAGESFYEAPNSVHLVSANASNKRPVRFLAYFVCDRKTPLSVAVPEGKRGGER
jgi:quercetin dioxygenase-like cupin family protein